MAEVIVRQQGCMANQIAYPREIDAFHQALRMLGECSLSSTGPGFSLDLVGGSVKVPVHTGITVQKTERRSWIVASIDDERHEISAVECATRQEAQTFALRMARALVADKVRAQFFDLTGRAIGRAHLARLARQADAIAQARVARLASGEAPDHAMPVAAAGAGDDAGDARGAAGVLSADGPGDAPMHATPGVDAGAAGAGADAHSTARTVCP